MPWLNCNSHDIFFSSSDCMKPSDWTPDSVATKFPYCCTLWSYYNLLAFLSTFWIRNTYFFSTQFSMFSDSVMIQKKTKDFLNSRKKDVMMFVVMKKERRNKNKIISKTWNRIKSGANMTWSIFRSVQHQLQEWMEYFIDKQPNTASNNSTKKYWYFNTWKSNLPIFPVNGNR